MALTRLLALDVQPAQTASNFIGGYQAGNQAQVSRANAETAAANASLAQERAQAEARAQKLAQAANVAQRVLGLPPEQRAQALDAAKSGVLAQLYPGQDMSWVTVDNLEGIVGAAVPITEQWKQDIRAGEFGLKVQDTAEDNARANAQAGSRMAVDRAQIANYVDTMAKRAPGGGGGSAGANWKPVPGVPGTFYNPSTMETRQFVEPPVSASEKAAQRKDEQNAEKDAMRREFALTRADQVLSAIGTAEALVGPMTTGIIGSWAGQVPGTSAYDLRRTVDTVKANIGFQELQAMREASPTGGALGQVAVQELSMLQAVLANLDANQSEAAIAENLQKVRRHFENWKSIVMQSGGAAQPPPPASPPAPAADPFAEADRILGGGQ